MFRHASVIEPKFSFYVNKENGTISVLSVSGLGNNFQAKCGHAYLKSPETDKGIWNVYFPDQLSEYYILNNGTDYDYYSAVYSCKQSAIGSIEEEGVILTRYKHPSFSQVMCSSHLVYESIFWMNMTQIKQWIMSSSYFSILGWICWRCF